MKRPDPDDKATWADPPEREAAPSLESMEPVSAEVDAGERHPRRHSDDHARRSHTEANDPRFGTRTVEWLLRTAQQARNEGVRDALKVADHSVRDQRAITRYVPHLVAILVVAVLALAGVGVAVKAGAFSAHTEPVTGPTEAPHAPDR